MVKDVKLSKKKVTRQKEKEWLRRNDIQKVAELLEHGITTDDANEDFLTALHQCSINNNVEMMLRIVINGNCGYLELVRILIDHGANLLAVNTEGNMPYASCDHENTLDYIEAEMSKRGVKQELIEETRSATERIMLRDLLDISKDGGDLEQPDTLGVPPMVVLEMLAHFGADFNIKNKDDESPSAQSVRRTSLRDNKLSTKLDAVEETRLCLQAQEVYVAATPDGTTMHPNGGSTDHSLKMSADWFSATASQQQQHHHSHPHPHPHQQHVQNNHNNNTLKTNNNHRNSYDPSLQDLVDSTTMTNSINASAMTQQQQLQPNQHSYQPRRPPEGRENDELQMQAFKMNGEQMQQHSTTGGGGAGTTTTSATSASAAIIAAATTRTTGQTEAVQIQSSKEATNGKINVQVTVLVGLL